MHIGFNLAPPPPIRRITEVLLDSLPQCGSQRLRSKLFGGRHLIAFNSALLVLFLFAWRFSGDARWHGWTAYSVTAGLLMMALLTAFGVANHRGGPAGVFEKLASLSRTSWSVFLVIKLYCGRRLTPIEHRPLHID
jgi:hypothetical protein